MQPPTAKTTEQAGDSAKLTNSCPRCAHGNAHDSLFCSACGTPLPVVPCPHCGAVNPVAADSCHQCHGKLSEDSADEPEAAVAGVEAVKLLSRRPKRLTAGVLAAGTVVLATLAFLGYQAYEMLSYVDLRLDKALVPTDVNRGVEERREAVDPGPIGRDGAVGDSSTEKVDRSVTSVPVPVSTSQAVPGDAVRTPTDRQRAPRQATVARAASGLGSQPCTEAIAAVALCPPGRGPAAKAETGAAIAPPRASASGKAVERARPDSVSCTQGAAALGLCTESIQRKE